MKPFRLSPLFVPASGALAAVLLITSCATTGGPPGTTVPPGTPGHPGNNDMVCDPATEAAARTRALAAKPKGQRVDATVVRKNFRPTTVSAIVQQDLAVVETDIVLGHVTSLKGLISSDTRRRWTGGVIPYEFDAAYSDNNRVKSAMEEWQRKTHVRFVPRTNERNFITIKRGTNPNIGLSSIGMVGSEQTFLMGDNCDMRVALHELGHTLGLWHEQSRPDRDKYICIRWSKIESGYADQFNIQLHDVTPAGAYDFDSIMHYFATAFGNPPGTPTMMSKIPGKKITGQMHLSSEDVATVNGMYP